jgi:hypothetical protein
MTNNYQLKNFTSQSLASTEQAWNTDLESANNVFPWDTWRIIELAKSQDSEERLSKGNSGNFVYGIFEGDSSVADAIDMVVLSKTTRMVVKLLDCFVRPSISEAAYNKGIEAISKLSKIYISAIYGVIEISDRHTMRTVKVYGRSDNLLTILATIAQLLNTQVSSFLASIEGRWLVVNKKN